MNYKLHYDTLIYRAHDRDIDGYVESHHIIPKCMGGTNDITNLVNLTPEEHFVAHQLLVKMFPNNYGLVKAANMMAVDSENNKRNNKLYGWLRKRLSRTMSISQSGSGNSQYGKCWIYNTELKTSKSIRCSELDTHLNLGWKRGRKLIFDRLPLKRYVKIGQRPSVLKGRESEFLEKYKKLGSMNLALKDMGFPGAISYYYKWARKLL